MTRPREPRPAATIRSADGRRAAAGDAWTLENRARAAASLRRALSEADWQGRVIDMAHRCGWDVFHVGDSRTATLRGWPDLALIRDLPSGACQLIMAELKTDTGRIRPEQGALLARLSLAGLDANVWRPKDWERVMELLARRR